MNRYFKTSDAKNFAFYKVPKALFEEKYKSVSTDAKMLYGLLLDRMYLSVKNGWIDNQGRVYQYFTIKSAQEKLHFGHEKICKLFFELEVADLIIRKRQGQGKVIRLRRLRLLPAEKRIYMEIKMIKNISIDLLVPFENHPFKKRNGIEQQELTESIKENGLLEPIIVRSFPAGKYEIISGHRRVEACKELGITSIPVTIKELTKDEAIVQMVDSNIHREHILPSEKAFAYKMKSEALKHQGKTYGQVVHKSRDNISDTESGRNVQRYIRLTNLIPELLKLVDEERIAFTPAVELSYLSEYEQQILLEQIEFTDATPSLSQAQRLRKFSKDGNFFVDTVFAVLNEEKPNQKEQVRIPADKLRDVLPKGLDKQKTEDFIIKACEHYRKYLIRQRERER